MLDHLLQAMNPGAVLFGSTILSEGVRHNWLAHRLTATYNRRGIFNNRHDRLDDLREVLATRFDDMALEAVGCVALFRARRRN